MTRCPACGGPNALERVRCTECGTAVEGRFSLGWAGRLSPEQSAFARVFLECRGKIKDVEEALGLSYPTVVARLDDVVRAVQSEPLPQSPPAGRREVLDQLAAGEIDVEEAVRRLKEMP